MDSAYTTKLGLCTSKIDAGAQKIDGFYLNTFEIVIADCLVKNKLGRVRFFKETFLLTNISLKMVLEMPFFIFSRTDIRFAKQKFVWRTYKAAKTLPTIRKVEIIDKREFVVAALNANEETFIVHIAVLAK